VAAVALLVLLNPLLARSSDDLILPPKAIAPPDSLVSNWMEECKTKGTPKACYNVAVFYAQVKGDEPKAIEYLRPLCQKGYGLGCFNLGGLLIKEKATRHEGMLAFRKACDLSKSASGTEEANQWTASACRYADTVQQYEGLDYMQLAVKLGLLPAPPSSTKSDASTDARSKAEIVQPVGEEETVRLQKLALVGVDPALFITPTYFFVADVDNDGQSEIVGVGYSGSGGYLDLNIYKEKNGKLVDYGLPPLPKGDHDGWSDYTASKAMFVRLAGRTYMELPGIEFGATEAFLWKDGKTTTACDADWTTYQRARFKKSYDDKQYDIAKGILLGHFRTCVNEMSPATRLSVLSDLAVTALHLGDYRQCVSMVKEARATPGFASSRSKKALLFNESACANPSADRKKADYRWLLGAGSSNPQMDPRYEELLAATVPEFAFDGATADRGSKAWLKMDVDRQARLASHAHLGSVRGVIREALTQPTDDVKDPIVGNRFVTLSGCIPHDCEWRAMLWVDVEQGTSVFASNNFDDCFVVASKTLGPDELPAEFRASFAAWRKRQPLKHTCVHFVDSRKPTPNVTTMK
jgi:hypothetical protein